MSLHLICIRFSTLSGSYLIPTQYAAKGNWVLRPRWREREKELFWRLFKFITVFCRALSGAHLVAQGCRGACYSKRVREAWGPSFADNPVSATLKLFPLAHFNTTCLLVCKGVRNTMKILMSQPHIVWRVHSADRWTLWVWFFFGLFYSKDWHEPHRFLFAVPVLGPIVAFVVSPLYPSPNCKSQTLSQSVHQCFQSSQILILVSIILSDVRPNLKFYLWSDPGLPSPSVSSLCVIFRTCRWYRSPHLTGKPQ